MRHLTAWGAHVNAATSTWTLSWAGGSFAAGGAVITGSEGWWTDQWGGAPAEKSRSLLCVSVMDSLSVKSHLKTGYCSWLTWSWAASPGARGLQRVAESSGCEEATAEWLDGWTDRALETIHRQKHDNESMCTQLHYKVQENTWKNSEKCNKSKPLKMEINAGVTPKQQHLFSDQERKQMDLHLFYYSVRP